jgi:hypothetical protein
MGPSAKPWSGGSSIDNLPLSLHPAAEARSSPIRSPAVSVPLIGSTDPILRVITVPLAGAADEVSFMSSASLAARGGVSVMDYP